MLSSKTDHESTKVRNHEKIQNSEVSFRVFVLSCFRDSRIRSIEVAITPQIRVYCVGPNRKKNRVKGLFAAGVLVGEGNE